MIQKMYLADLQYVVFQGTAITNMIC